MNTSLVESAVTLSRIILDEWKRMRETLGEDEEMTAQEMYILGLCADILSEAGAINATNNPSLEGYVNVRSVCRGNNTVPSEAESAGT